jgi:hypothetical protein
MENKKKPAKSKEKPKQVSASSVAVATALLKHFPEEAGKILKVMAEASTSASMKRKLDRCVRALDRLRQKEGA